jgi:hypothetical protein
MSLASEDDLNGTVRIAEDAREAFGVTQEQRGSLVRDKTSDETNSERIRVEERIRGRETRRIGTAAGKLLVAANTGELDEPGAPATLSVPQRLVLGLDQWLPRDW